VNVLTRSSVIHVGYGTFIFISIIGAVYRYVWNFHNWYIRIEIGLLRFSGTYAYFISGISKYLTGSTIVIVLRWEEIGLMSILLIRY